MLPFPNLTAPKPNHVIPWSYLPNLISESFETAAGHCVTMFWNMSTWPLFSVWSCWFYWEGPLVKHRDCLYNNITNVTFNRCHDCVCHLQLWISLLFCLWWKCFLVCVMWQTPSVSMLKMCKGFLKNSGSYVMINDPL